jgi:hypothetical protein
LAETLIGRVSACRRVLLRATEVRDMPVWIGPCGLVASFPLAAL